MDIDPRNPVVALCAAGMAIKGDAEAARRLFEQAWDARTDDYDASIAASLYLNLADSLRLTGDRASARQTVAVARAHLPHLADSGYGSFVELGINRLEERLASASP